MRVDPFKCGLGESAACCAYLLLGDSGPVCGRETDIKPVIEARVAEGSMKAIRLPVQPYPACQEERA